jgi:hypothetical protein
MRSQRQLLSETLHAGNLKAHLDGISLVDVQSVLSRHFLQNQRDRSIFPYLVEPGDGIPPHEAASAVLQELVSKTENVVVLATLAYRSIEAKGLWKGHPDPSVKSADDLIQKLDAGSDAAQANIVIGASALRQRRNYIRLIEEAWRPGWFDNIPSLSAHLLGPGPKTCHAICSYKSQPTPSRESPSQRPSRAGQSI